MPSLRRTHGAGLLLGVLILTLAGPGEAVTKRPKPAAEAEASPHSSPKRTAGPASASMPEKRVPQAPPQDKVRQLARIWVYWDAVYPAAIKLKPGGVLLRVENRMGSEVNIVLNRVSGGTPGLVASLGVQGKVLRSTQAVQLGAGSYVYYDQARPTIKGRLIVEP